LAKPRLKAKTEMGKIFKFMYIIGEWDSGVWGGGGPGVLVVVSTERNMEDARKI
jgi:hypothetical protein